VLRPAGELDPDGERRLVGALEAAATASDVVVVDVGAVGPLPGTCVERFAGCTPGSPPQVELSCCSTPWATTA